MIAIYGSIFGRSEHCNITIRQSEIFVDNFQSSEYLTKRREKVKAKLGVALSVFCPDKVFTTMNELLESVDWSESEVSRKQFGLLEEI